MKKIGTVVHFYDKISVAVIQLTGDLKLKDKVKFIRGGEDLFEEEVTSMQIEHNQVETAKSGDEVAIKVVQKAREGSEVYLLE